MKVDLTKQWVVYHSPSCCHFRYWWMGITQQAPFLGGSLPTIQAFPHPSSYLGLISSSTQSPPSSMDVFLFLFFFPHKTKRYLGVNSISIFIKKQTIFLLIEKLYVVCCSQFGFSNPYLACGSIMWKHHGYPVLSLSRHWGFYWCSWFRFYSF